MVHLRWPLLLTLGALLLLGGCATERNSSPSKATHSKSTQNAHQTLETVGPEAQSSAVSVAEPQTPPKNLWQRLRRGFELQDQTTRPQVQRWIQFYLARRGTLEATLQRAEPFMWHIVQSLDKRSMPLEIALLPAVESAFNPTADSSSHAVGLWQFLPGTGRRFGLVDNWWYDGRRDVRNSTRAALDYLQYLSNLFNDNWLLAIAAYNAGGGRIQNAVAYNRAHGRPTDFWDLSLPQETTNYVPKLLALSAVIDNPEKYGIQLPPLPNKPLVKSVKIPSQIDLQLVAKLSGISLQRVYDLNPGYKRWATAPSGPNRLLLPVSAAVRFKEKLADIPRSRLVTWRRHRVAHGDTLIAIARHYGTSVHLLKRINHLNSNVIRVGQKLLIPFGRHHVDHYDIAKAEHTTSPKPHERRIVHRVKSGDTLWSLAHHYGVSVAELARWNGISARATLKPGEKLHIFAQAKGTTAKRHTVYYTVKRGDSLWHIAQLFQVNIQQLKSWNNLDTNHYLQAGQQLKVVLNAST